MSTLRYVLIGAAVLLLAVISVVLVMRDLPPRSGAAPQAARPEPATPAANLGDRIEQAASPPAAQAALPPPPPPAPVEEPEPAPAGPLNFTEEQADRIRYVLLSHSIMQAEGADVPLRIGGSVPKDVELTPVPGELDAVIPGRRHYSYAIVQSRIVIVTTERREISALLPF